MTTRLFNGPICQARNWYVDVNSDGTAARTPGEPPGPINTHSAKPSHHAHHSYHTHHLHRVHHTHHHVHHGKHHVEPVKKQPIRMMIFDPRKVLRLLNYVAVLKARRDRLVLAWETYDELRDQNKKNIPDHSGRPEVFKSVLFGATTVETGDIYEALRDAKILTNQWMQEFVVESSKGGKEPWYYLVRKRDEGHEHLQAMARVYSRAATVNVHARQSADTAARVAKTIKLSCDVLVTVIGAIHSKGVDKRGMAVEVAYQVLSNEDIWNHVWGVDDPHVVGVAKEDGPEKEQEGEEHEGVSKEVASVVAKELVKKAEEHLEEAMKKKAEDIIVRNLGMKGPEFAQKLATFQKMVAKQASRAWRDWDKGILYPRELGALSRNAERVAHQEDRYVRAMKLAKRGTIAGKSLEHALKTARWVFVVHEVKAKLKEIQNVWDEPVEGEERANVATAGE